jgi:hypothetical protein
MKYLAFVFLAALATSRAASAPKDVFSSLEILRRQLVVARVILDEPSGKLAKECQFTAEMIGTMGGALESRLANELPEATEIIGHEQRLLKALSMCMKRGSCSLYVRIFESVSEGKVSAQLAKALKRANELVKKESAGTFRGALSTVPAPCRVLRALTEPSS